MGTRKTFFTQHVLYSKTWKELCGVLGLILESAVVAPCVTCFVDMRWNFFFRGTWPVGHLLPTLMCICWSVVGSECPDRLAMDFGGAGAAQQGLTDSCQSGGVPTVVLQLLLLLHRPYKHLQSPPCHRASAGTQDCSSHAEAGAFVCLYAGSGVSPFSPPSETEANAGRTFVPAHSSKQCIQTWLGRSRGLCTFLSLLSLSGG